MKPGRGVEKAELSFHPQAQAHLADLFRWVEAEAGAEVADRYLARIEAKCATLTAYPNRGNPREDLGAGVRTYSFERRLVIAYRVEGDTVVILAVAHGARETQGMPDA